MASDYLNRLKIGKYYLAGSFTISERSAKNFILTTRKSENRLLFLAETGGASFIFPAGNGSSFFFIGKLTNSFDGYMFVGHAMKCWFDNIDQNRHN